jgi:hypothetical protein
MVRNNVVMILSRIHPVAPEIIMTSGQLAAAYSFLTANIHAPNLK